MELEKQEKCITGFKISTCNASKTTCQGNWTSGFFFTLLNNVNTTTYIKVQGVNVKGF